MPLANCTTAANGSERDQVLPLLDRVKLKTLKREPIPLIIFCESRCG